MELIDPALLRAGRMEVHVRVDLPDRSGRQQIIDIHSGQLRERGCVDIEALAALRSGALAAATEGYSGAEIAGLLRSASSFALERYVDHALLNGWMPGTDIGSSSRASKRNLEVSFSDLRQALLEIEEETAGSRRRVSWIGKRRKLAKLDRLTRKAVGDLRER